jgi:autotransporter translocation and assembly factor TamB
MRVARRLARVLIVVLTLIVGAAAAAIVVSQTAWFKNWLRGYVVRQANQYLNGSLSIERLAGNLFFGVEFENIGISMDGKQVVAVKDLGLDYNVFELLTRGLSVANIRLDQPVVYLRREGDSWSLSRLLKRQQTEADSTGPGRAVSIDDIGITDGSVVVERPAGAPGVEVPERIERLDAKLSFKYEPVRYSIEISHVSFRGREPAFDLNALSGAVVVRDDTVLIDKLSLRTPETSLSLDGAVQHYQTKPELTLHLLADRLSVPEIARIVPSIAPVLNARLQPAVELTFDGPLDRLGVEVDARSSAGSASGRIVANVVGPAQSVTGDLSVRHIDLARLLNGRKPKSDVNVNAHLDIRGESFSDVDSLRGSVSLDSPHLAMQGYAAGPVTVKARIDEGRRVDLEARAAAYGASATATGRVTVPRGTEPIAYEVAGQARNLDLRRFPRDLKLPAAATGVSADYHVSGRGAVVDADARLQPSTAAGATIEGGSTVRVAINGSDIEYSADATLSNVDLQRLGQEFGVPTLAAERYKTVINGHLTAEGRGTKLDEMTMDATGELKDTSILGGDIPQLDFDAEIADGTAHAWINGAFAGFDPAVLSGRPDMKGRLGGRLDVDATLADVESGVTPESVTATVNLTLDSSSIGQVEITRAALEGDYYDSTGTIRTLDIASRDLNVKARGTLALNDTGESSLQLHADSPGLDAIGKLVDQKLAGIAELDATVTGNRRQLQAEGKFTGDALKYGDDGALAVSTDFTAKVPDLGVERASVSAVTHAAFVSLAGQHVNELDAKTDYAGNQVDFDVTAKQPQRSLSAAGSLLLNPGYPAKLGEGTQPSGESLDSEPHGRQEVRLSSLNLQSQGVQWRKADGTAAVIQYDGDTISVKDLRLVSGAQQIDVDGTFGRPGDGLGVSLNDIDLATVDALLLRPAQLSGRLNATSTIGGTKDAPSVASEFKIDQGGFRQFRYESFGGTVNYADKGVRVDARLQQNPTTWLEAKGYAPIAADAANNQYDLHVASSPIDLGIVQGFTTALTNVKGTLQVKADVTGPADDPRPVGAVAVEKGTFTAASTGVTYRELDGRIDLRPENVHIDQIRLLDNRNKPLTISGDLAIREREVGSIGVNVKASDFRVIDNKMGDVRVNSDLRLTGELRAPRIEGDLGLSTGNINLDAILAQVGGGAYSTKETAYPTSSADASQQPVQPGQPGEAAGSRPSAQPVDAERTEQAEQPAPSSPFDAVQLDVHLTVPNDLVVKANDLKAPNAPIGLGALNITLGGDLWASKAPWDQVRLVGVVNTVRGTYEFQGRRFTILRDGTVRFEGTDDINPALDIRTERIIQAVTARVNVQGTLEHPEIVLSSVPPLEQADILSLIVFNQPINQLGEGQQISLAQRAQSMAIGAAASELSKSIGSALNLDTFEINTAPETGGGPSLTVGQQVGQNLYLKVQQGIGDTSQTNVILEYELTKWLRFRTNMLQGASTPAQLFQRMQGSGADLLFFFTY